LDEDGKETLRGGGEGIGTQGGGRARGTYSEVLLSILWDQKNKTTKKRGKGKKTTE